MVKVKPVPVKIFAYSISSLLPVYSGLVALFLLNLLAIYVSISKSITYSLPLWIFADVLALPFMLNAIFLKSELHVDECGVSAVLWNFPWRRILWCDVVLFYCISYDMVLYGGKSVNYYIGRDARKKPYFVKGGDIVFGSDIQNVAALVSQVQDAVIEYGVNLQVFPPGSKLP